MSKKGWVTIDWGKSKELENKPIYKIDKLSFDDLDTLRDALLAYQHRHEELLKIYIGNMYPAISGRAIEKSVLLRERLEKILRPIKDDIRKQTESPVSESRLKEIEESELTFNNE